MKTDDKNSGGFFNFLFVFVAGFLACFFGTKALYVMDNSALETKVIELNQAIADLEHKNIKQGVQLDEVTDATLILLEKQGFENVRLEKMNAAAKANSFVNK